MTLRRILALLLLLAAGLAQVEPVWGELRDGEVHHESVQTALAHHAEADGDHGHEDAGAPEHPHGEDHQHGTTLDHCTHHHSAAAVTSVAFSMPSDHRLPAYTQQTAPVVWTPTGFFRPPKA
jgi:hypothetical protein